MPAAPRHPRHDYRCSLPGLTEFTVLRREGTDTATIDGFIIRCSGTGGNGENTLRNFYRSGGWLACCIAPLRPRAAPLYARPATVFRVTQRTDTIAIEMNTPLNTRRLRYVEFEGTRNFRDLGGIPTPAGTTLYGVVYRSDRLSNLTDADRVHLKRLGITTIIDMRTHEEQLHAPNRLPADERLQEISRSFLPRRTLEIFAAINSGAYGVEAAYDAMLEQYKTLALEHATDYGRIIEDLLQPGITPAVVHCTSGKDRTGLVAAVILLALDAPRAEITADYVMTHNRIEKIDFFTDSADPHAIDVVMAADPAYLAAALAAMESEFGSVASYLREAVGMTFDKRRRLQALLVDGRANDGCGRAPAND